MGASENSGTPKSSIFIGFSIIFTIHFGVPLFLETPMYVVSKVIPPGIRVLIPVTYVFAAISPCHLYCNNDRLKGPPLAANP